MICLVIYEVFREPPMVGWRYGTGCEWTPEGKQKRAVRLEYERRSKSSVIKDPRMLVRMSG